MFFFLATGPVSLQIDVVSNLPKKQDLVNEVREKFAQLQRLSVELQNAPFQMDLDKSDHYTTTKVTGRTFENY